MYNLDSLTLKYFYEENRDIINNAIVQKIQQPSRYEIILNIRNLNSAKARNKKLYININPDYPHICFINENTLNLRNITTKKHPPMFCMQLRKYLNGSKIKDFRLVKYERILEFYFDYFDEIGSLAGLCLSIELMGRHSNIILYNAVNKIILGSIHNISKDKSSVREIYGGINYTYPPQKNKLDILNVSYSTFFEIAKNKIIKEISDNFYYFSQSILNEVLNKYDKTEDIYSFLQSLANGDNIDFITDFWSKGNISVGNALDDYFSKIMFFEILKKQKTKLKNVLKNDYKKYAKTAEILLDDKKLNKLKLCGDLIMGNLYSVKTGQEEIVLAGIKIKTDKNLSPAQNAQMYYQKYKKEKIAFEYAQKRYNIAKERLNYYDEILFNIENAADFYEIKEIFQELSEIGLIQDTKKEQLKPKIEKIDYGGYEIYIGKNNKQNDFLISKIAKDEDLWFHGQNFPSGHIILKVPNNKAYPPSDVIEFCAKLTKENSKAKNSTKAPIIMTKRKNLKKPPNTYLGYVTYKNEIEIVI